MMQRGDGARRRRREAAGLDAAGLRAAVRPAGRADDRGAERPRGRRSPSWCASTRPDRGATSPATITSRCRCRRRRSAPSSSSPGCSSWSTTRSSAQGLVRATWSDDSTLDDAHQSCGGALHRAGRARVGDPGRARGQGGRRRRDRDDQARPRRAARSRDRQRRSDKQAPTGRRDRRRRHRHGEAQARRRPSSTRWRSTPARQDRPECGR